eukprot:10446711-Lingulodinium_polyedra.AAC.1
MVMTTMMVMTMMRLAMLRVRLHAPGHGNARSYDRTVRRGYGLKRFPRCVSRPCIRAHGVTTHGLAW